MHWSTVLWAVLYYIFVALYYAVYYPVVTVLLWILYILYWFATPFIAVGNVVKDGLLIPYRVLVQFEVRLALSTWTLQATDRARRHSGTGLAGLSSLEAYSD